MVSLFGHSEDGLWEEEFTCVKKVADLNKTKKNTHNCTPSHIRFLLKLTFIHVTWDSVCEKNDMISEMLGFSQVAIIELRCFNGAFSFYCILI